VRTAHTWRRRNGAHSLNHLPSMSSAPIDKLWLSPSAPGCATGKRLTRPWAAIRYASRPLLADVRAAVPIAWRSLPHHRATRSTPAGVLYQAPVRLRPADLFHTQRRRGPRTAINVRTVTREKCRQTVASGNSVRGDRAPRFASTRAVSEFVRRLECAECHSTSSRFASGNLQRPLRPFSSLPSRRKFRSTSSRTACNDLRL